jgi:hypothetical protein
MPRGEQRHYTDKQKRQVEHIEKGYEERGVPGREAERRAWATVNQVITAERTRRRRLRRSEDHEPMRKGGRKAAGDHTAVDASDRGWIDRSASRAAIHTAAAAIPEATQKTLL